MRKNFISIKKSRDLHSFWYLVALFATLALCGSVSALTKSELSNLISECDSGDLSSCAAVEAADTSTITDMSGLFRYGSFTGDISGWDVSSVTTMQNMFEMSSFTGNISKWNVSAVKDMSWMFYASWFTGDISKWDVSAVNDMSDMFNGSPFTGDISKWDVSAVNDMTRMFAISSFTGDLSQWDVSSVETMAGMFAGGWDGSQHVKSPFTVDLSKWDVSAVNNMQAMFELSSFTGNLSQWDVSSVTDMSWMFSGSAFTGNIGEWDVSSVTDMSLMFYDSAFTGNISKWNVSSVKDMSWMFWGSPFTGNISKWNVSAVKDMSYMFQASAFYGDLCAWNLGQRTSGPSMVQQDGMFVNSFLENSDFGCQPTCNDKEQNENETTVDCGGTYSCQTGCAVGISQPQVASTTPVTPGCLLQFSPEDIDSLVCAKAPVDSPNCQEARKWEQLYLEYETGANPAFVTGGLGSLMTMDKFEVWVCLRGHPCLLEAGVNPAQGDLMCFVYDEGDRRFIPWDKQSNLNLV